MPKLKAVIYRGPDADLTLPIRILKAEGISWEIEDDVPKMMGLAKGCCNPQSGWVVYLPAFNEGTSTWTGLYRMLDKRGLLYC